MNTVLQCKVRRLWEEDRGFPFVLDFYANGLRIANGVYNFKTKKIAEAYAHRLGFRYTTKPRKKVAEPGAYPHTGWLDDLVDDAKTVTSTHPTGVPSSMGAPTLMISEILHGGKKYTLVTPQGEAYNDEPWAYLGWYDHVDIVRWYTETVLH